ncbi:MAG TPA: AI-2E family transporter [Candidatus Saccharimonadales bacterium]|nr:AI-2E family transporter [Candidatus Saccharimonadales bacterium]
MTATLFALGGLFLYAAWRVIIAFLFAIFLAYLLEAPVSRLAGWLRGSRSAAIAAIYLFLLTLIIVLLVRTVPAVMHEAQGLKQQAPQWAAKFSSDQIEQQMKQHGWNEKTVTWVRGLVADHQGDIINAAQGLVLGAFRSLQETWWLLLVPILAIFFLKDGRMFGDMLINSVKHENNRQIAAATVQRMNSMLGDFLRSQVLLSVIAMVVITLVLSAMRVDYALALGPAAGALEFVPVVGPFIGIALITGAAFLSGYNHVLWVLIFLLVWRGIQDYVTSPRIMGDKLELHSLAVLFGVLAGGEVAGVIGVFLSIPVLATLRILWHTWQLYRLPATPAAEPPAM